MYSSAAAAAGCILATDPQTVHVSAGVLMYCGAAVICTVIPLWLSSPVSLHTHSWNKEGSWQSSEEH